MSQPSQITTPLPDMLRGLRVGLDDETRIKRTVHLAAAKIEALEAQIGTLREQLEHVGSRTAPKHQRVTH